jgi:hypothetical protein
MSRREQGNGYESGGNSARGLQWKTYAQHIVTFGDTSG